MLAEVAMQLDPNDKEAYMIYKKTIGTKNKFCDFTARLAHVLGLPISKFCSLFTFVYFKNKNIYYFLYFLSIFGWVILPVYLTGWYAGSVYIVFLMMFFISSKIQQNIYKEVGLGTSFDAKDNLRSNKFSREQETTKMARTVEKVEPTKKLSPEEIEAQVTSFGSKGAVFEKQPIEEVARKPQLSSEEHKEIQSYSNIKSPRYNKWYICLLIILSLILVFRVGKLYNSNHNEDKNTVPSNSEEERKDYNFNLKEDKNAVPNNSEEERKSIVVSKDKISKEEKMEQIYLASSTLYLLETSDFSENSLRQFVMDNYVSVVMEKAGQPSIQKLKSENLARIYKEGTNTYLLVKSDDSTFILEISEKKINRIYGENWDNSEQEIKIYHELLNKFKMESVQQE